jgi:hypothetical protein
VLECDHVTAVANGGGDDMGNLVTSCWDCNRGKGTKTVRKMRANSRMSPVNDNGLIGLYGHRLDEEGDIHNQFQITGMVGESSCVIQLFSFLDGCATKVEIVAANDLTTSSYVLYPSQSAFKMAYWKDKERRGDLRGKTAEEAYAQDQWFARVMNGEAA